MRYAAFVLAKEPAKTRVGIVSADGKTVQELDLGVDVNEDGIVAILKSDLAGKLPKPTSTHAFSDIRLLAPVPRPRRNIFCVGKNYHEHAKEFSNSGFDGSAKPGEDIPSHAIFFTKPPEAVTGPNTNVIIPTAVSTCIDYEAELTIVIGKGGKGISEADAMKHVWGYTAINDVTARDWQQRHKQWFLGKSFDTFCPMGPWVVTADEVDAQDIAVKCWVNGELRQNSNTADFIHNTQKMLSYISTYWTLEPGDIVFTGTPQGVIAGMPKDKQVWLKKGDKIVSSVEKLGDLKFTLA